MSGNNTQIDLPARVDQARHFLQPNRVVARLD